MCWKAEDYKLGPASTWERVLDDRGCSEEEYAAMLDAADEHCRTTTLLDRSFRFLIAVAIVYGAAGVLVASGGGYARHHLHHDEEMVDGWYLNAGELIGCIMVGYGVCITIIILYEYFVHPRHSVRWYSCTQHKTNEGIFVSVCLPALIVAAPVVVLLTAVQLLVIGTAAAASASAKLCCGSSSAQQEDVSQATDATPLLSESHKDATAGAEAAAETDKSV